MLLIFVFIRRGIGVHVGVRIYISECVKSLCFLLLSPEYDLCTVFISSDLLVAGLTVILVKKAFKNPIDNKRNSQSLL